MACSRLHTKKLTMAHTGDLGPCLAAATCCKLGGFPVGLQSTHNSRAPKGHINTRILHFGSEIKKRGMHESCFVGPFGLSGHSGP